MKKIQNIIKQIFEYNQSYDDFFDDFDDCYTICFSEQEKRIIECLSQTPEKRWSDNMFEKALNLINKYKDDLSNIDIEIGDEERSLLSEKSSKTENIAYIEGDLICIKNQDKNKILTENLNVFKIENDNVYIHFNYSNVHEIILLHLKSLVEIDLKLKNKINLFINQIQYRQKTCITKKIKNDNYQVDLLDYQEAGTLFGILNKKVLIADEMGLGKTIQALSIISLTGALPLFIICPKSLKYKWEKECKKIKNASIHLYQKNDDLSKITKDIYIFSYNDLPKIIDILEIHKNIKSIIFDESHSLKDKKTQRSKCCKKLTKNKEFIIELTGSPVLNKTSELLNQIEILNHMNIFGSNIDFLNNYCQREKLYKREDIEKFCLDEEAKKLENLSKIMKENFYIRRKKADTLFSLPEKRRDFIYVDINNKKQYQYILNEYKKESDNKKKKQLLSKLKEIAGKGKFGAIKEQINEFIESGEKTIVFAYHKKMQQRLIEEYPNALTITANSSEQERFETQELFLNDPSKKIIICSIRAAYYGLDLYSSSQIIFAEMDWTPEINKQCEDRGHRIGLHHPLNIWYIIAKDTIEEKIVKINKEKIDIIKNINQEKDDFLINQSKEKIKDILIQSL